MELEPKQKKDLEKISKGLASRTQPDPYVDRRTLYNPATGDLYISVSDINGNIRRKVINLLGE
jgi:translation elongation factor EF-G